jgi:hypothetical protein
MATTTKTRAVTKTREEEDNEDQDEDQTTQDDDEEDDDVDEDFDEDDEEEEDDDDFDDEEMPSAEGVDTSQIGKKVVLKAGDYPGEVKSCAVAQSKSSGRKQFNIVFTFRDHKRGMSTTVYEYWGLDEAGWPFTLARLQQLDIDPSGKKKGEVAEEIETKYVRAKLGVDKATRQYPAKNRLIAILEASDEPFDEDDSDDDF